MPDISKIKALDGVTYNIKDDVAREGLETKAPLDSPTFTGTPTAPTASANTNNTQIATTAFVKTVAGDYIKNGDKLLTSSPFLSGTGVASGKKIYISKLDNGFWCASKRWTVTATNGSESVSSANIDKLFDGDYDGQCWSIYNGDSSVILFDFSNESTGCLPGYPYGQFLVSFYYVAKPASITGRVYCNYETQGVGWHNITFTNIFGSVYSADNSYYNISKLEITIVGDTTNSYGRTAICEIEFAPSRPGIIHAGPMITKYSPQTLYYSLTAPSFIGDLTGNASTATKLAASKTIQTNLASTSSASFDGSANITPGIIGTLGTGNGGTGVSTLGTSGQVLKVNSAGTALEWGTVSSSVTATKQKLVKTTVPNITSVGSAPTLGTAFSVPNVTGNTSVSASKVTKTDDTFVKTISQATSTSSVIGTVSGGVLTLSKAITAVGAVSAGTTGTASAVSISNVTATNTTLGTAFSIPNVTSVGSAPTLGTAISVATGATSTSGTGSEVVIDVSSS